MCMVWNPVSCFFELCPGHRRPDRRRSARLFPLRRPRSPWLKASRPSIPACVISAGRDPVSGAY
jgi:hypothetical protein